MNDGAIVKVWQGDMVSPVMVFNQIKSLEIVYAGYHVELRFEDGNIIYNPASTEPVVFLGRREKG